MPPVSPRIGRRIAAISREADSQCNIFHPRFFWNGNSHPPFTPKTLLAEPAAELPRMHIDNAYHTAIAEGKIIYRFQRNE
jgi:hypothetical protein